MILFNFNNYSVALFKQGRRIAGSVLQGLDTLIDSIPLHRIFRLRQRYLMTSKNKLRLRYVAGYAAVVLVALSFSVQDSGILHSQVSSAPTYDVATSEIKEATQENLAKTEVSYGRIFPENLLELARLTTPRIVEKEKELKIRSGDTFGEVLQNAGLSSEQALKAVEAIKDHIDVRKIQAGQTVQVSFDKNENTQEENLTKLVMEVDPLKSVTLERVAENEFQAEVHEKELIKRTRVGRAEIQNSLYGSAARAGIPPQVIGNMIRMYSFTVDFQRDIRREDRIEVMYDVYETEDGTPVKYGEILYANLHLGDVDLNLYRFEDANGTAGYYDSLGRTTKKTLMKTPVDGARISSGFGMRKHPILGYNKMHKGMDFAASLGTPVYAAGDGTIEKIGRNGAYGNYVRIRHTSTMKTAYAHLHKFGKGLRNGSRVKQGDVIGYVGSTGRSTGPHLHYEVMLNNQQVNPNRVDLPTGENLKGRDLERYKDLMKDYRQQFVSLAEGLKFASRTTEHLKSGG